MKKFEKGIKTAVRHFWEVRETQHNKQRSAGKKDQGSRGAVTGGSQLDGFINFITGLLIEAKIPESAIFKKRNIELPGFFRPTKEWDLLVIINNNLLASIELKSHVGPSFGNNYNNRTEEALGSATDIWTAYREGAFKTSPRPWLGYFMLLEDAPKSTNPVTVREPHFSVFSEFQDASYAKRYELLCEKLLRERLYDAACLLMSDRRKGLHGNYLEPNTELSFERFIKSLLGHVLTQAKLAEH